jgi:CRP/FNR family transcriptional regulator
VSAFAGFLGRRLQPEHVRAAVDPGPLQIGSSKDGLRPVTIRYKTAPFLTRPAFGCHPEAVIYPTSTRYLRGIVMLSANHAVQAQNYNEIAVVCGADPICLQSLFRKLPVEQLETGRSLFFEGDPAKHLFELVEGVLRIVKIMADGRRVITGFLFPGDLVGVSLRNHYLYSAEAVTPAKLRRFSRKTFEDIVSGSPELRPQLFARLCDEMAAAQDQMVLLSCKNAEERLCSFLLQQLRRKQEQDRSASVVDLPMTRLDIADYLGLTIETISRTVTKLTNRGIINPVGRHSIHIAKPGMLAHLAGDGEECHDGNSSVVVFDSARRRH